MPQSGGVAINNAGGTYGYQTSFDLTGYNPGSASIAMQLCADSGVVSVFLNGTSTGITEHAGPPFTLIGPFAINSGFASGVNHLDFVVFNSLSPGPTGLRRADDQRG